ncbi:cob(I)yrinic acid a,c-diamide adenosyltransferase [Derxia lacustris]|uniref:cob(I)yrinic acid a,c-diamide adenosyltransferase n=1 Tax=Derxia lacustris TaxID=764842 RepID=UPI000A177028|nr:cob(I)yrinic acid a,c-diamide adenosyltransferase [Derxia lacustris]
MADRLSRIVTRSGDAGLTGLADGSRVPKDAARIAALGDIDECGSALGLLICELDGDARFATLAQELVRVQHDLFDLGGELSLPGHPVIAEAQVARLEAWIERDNAALPPLRNFVLAGGSRAAASAHLARTVARRAERAIVHLGHVEPVSEPVRQYINRLSDWLFVVARRLNAELGRPDVLWQQRAPDAG